MQKLTKTQQLNLVHEWTSTNISQQQLAEKYGVSLARIKQIVKGHRRYRDLKGMLIKWREPATKETEGGLQLFKRNYKEYSYYTNDEFWLHDRIRKE